MSEHNQTLGTFLHASYTLLLLYRRAVFFNTPNCKGKFPK